MCEINVCISTDDNYAKHCAVVIASAVKNADADDDLRFHILSDNLSETNRQRLMQISPNVNIIDINRKIFEPFEKMAKTLWALPTLFRINMPSLFKDLGKILYLDCDVIVRGSLKELYNTDISNYHMAAVMDYNAEQSASRLGMKSDKYFNAGVILANLDLWRRDNKSQECMDYLAKNEKSCVFGDQDVLNYVFDDLVCFVDKKFNYIPIAVFKTKKHNEEWIKMRDNIVIMHYAGMKPWEYIYKTMMNDEYWDYYVMTEWEKTEPYEKFRRVQVFLNFRPFLILRYLKRYPFCLFNKRRGEFLQLFD